MTQLGGEHLPAQSATGEQTIGEPNHALRRVGWLVGFVVYLLVAMLVLFTVWGDSSEPNGQRGAAFLLLSAVVPLGWALQNLTRLARKRWRGARTLPATVVEVKTRGIQATWWYDERPVLRFREPGGAERDVTSATPRANLTVGEQVDVLVDARDSRWVAVTDQSWTDRLVAIVVLVGSLAVVGTAIWSLADLPAIRDLSAAQSNQLVGWLGAVGLTVLTAVMYVDLRRKLRKAREARATLPESELPEPIVHGMSVRQARRELQPGSLADLVGRDQRLAMEIPSVGLAAFGALIMWARALLYYT